MELYFKFLAYEKIVDYIILALTMLILVISVWISGRR